MEKIDREKIHCTDCGKVFICEETVRLNDTRYFVEHQGNACWGHPGWACVPKCLMLKPPSVGES